MDKVLIVTHNARFVVQFELNDIALLQSMGYEVHCATNMENESMIADARQILEERGVVLHQITIQRSPLKLVQNVKAYNQLKKLMCEERFAGVHCHTPMGGMLGRLAAQSANVKPVLYTAHGFHFYKGCPLQNRLIYENVERFLARYTDAIITINQEDFEAADSFHKRGKAYKIPGVGVDIDKYTRNPNTRTEKRREMGIPENALVFISAGELNKNKNHEVAVKAFAEAKIPNAYYLICGEGPLKSKLINLSKELSIEDKVLLLGFRRDIPELLAAADISIFPSIREGLGLAAIEALAAGIPVIASDMRGSREFYQDGVVALCAHNDVKQFAAEMRKWSQKVACKRTAIVHRTRAVAELFSLKEATDAMKKVYSEML